MKIENNRITAENGKWLVRKKDNWIAGEEVILGKCFSYIDGTILDEPIQEVPEHYIEISCEDLKVIKLKDLEKYDKSNNVNEFTYNGNTMWIDFDLRKSIAHDINVLKAKNIKEFVFWNNNIPMTFPIYVLEKLLIEIEIYALKCFNVTAQHKANIEALETIEEVNNYNFKTGYPEKLSL